MSPTTWALFAATELLLCLSPGPAVLFVVAQGLGRGGRHSLWANAGILAGNAFYFALSALGLGATLLASYRLFTAVKWAGAAYLVYLGLQTIRGAGLSLAPENPARAETTGWRTLARGFALQTANPKALVFFVALLPQFIDVHGGVAAQVAVLAVTSVVIEFAVLAGYGFLAGSAHRLARSPRFATVTDRISGVLLIGAGAGVALAGGPRLEPTH
jgi:threonine/homoserine/homoserine lactone efflux protein